jgi:hypothetical protein
MMALILLVVWGCGQRSSLTGQVVDGRGQSMEKVKPMQVRFTGAPNGVITDHATGLDWYVGPKPDNNWKEAKAWTENLTVAGGGWRLPDMMELKALYQKGASPIHMDPLFQLPGAWVWSGQLHDASFAWGFAFYSGLEGWHSVDYGYGRVVLAVRSRR